MTQLLQEYVASPRAALHVDREAGIIRGVKILGLVSRNGRRYLPGAVEAAAPLYEGAKVNVNHPKGHPQSSRDYQDRIGVIRNVALRREEGLFGELHINPRHALAEQLMWDAQHAPENVGLSHNVEARTATEEGQAVVEAILKVRSVDLVADPASTRGLYEAQDSDDGHGRQAIVQSLTVEELRRHRPELVADLTEAMHAELVDLRKQLEQVTAKSFREQRRALVRRWLAEHDLPEPSSGAAGAALIGDELWQQLLEAADESEVRTLIEQRARLVRGVAAWQSSGKRALEPLSREQTFFDGAVAPPADAAAFAKAISARS